MLQGFLNYQRDTMVWKVEGLDRTQALLRLVPSGTTLLGMLKHLAYVERYWFRSVLAAEDVPFPWSDHDPDADWRIEPGETVESIIALYREECGAADGAAAAYALDDVSRGQDRHFSLRWILGHMIEETARHCGQADILRELTDGAVGACQQSEESKLAADRTRPTVCNCPLGCPCPAATTAMVGTATLLIH